MDFAKHLLKVLLMLRHTFIEFFFRDVNISILMSKYCSAESYKKLFFGLNNRRPIFSIKLLFNNMAIILCTKI